MGRGRWLLFAGEWLGWNEEKGWLLFAGEWLGR